MLPRASFQPPPRRRIRRRPPKPLARTMYSNYIREETMKKHQKQELTLKPQYRAMLCLLIAAHNEELVIAKTINSAIAAGMKPEHIYVVDDNSSDPTTKIARGILPRQNVAKVRRSGKGLALAKAAKKFELTKRYRWIHIADADGAFAPNYFAVFRKALRVENAAATGYIKSLPGRRISEYRIFEYTLGMELHRRIQSMLGVIPIIPGPTSCFRADVFEKVNFANQALTEDFDVTLQLHRQNLGRIQFIPEAVAYTQDPPTLKAFVRQILRWNRGVMQGVRRHKIGTKLTPIDMYLTYQIAQSLLLFVNCFVWLPYMMVTRGGASFLATTFLFDVFLTFLINFFIAIKARRFDAVSAFPVIYALKWVSLLVFIRAFVEVMILRKFKISKGAWNTGRYTVAAAKTI